MAAKLKIPTLSEVSTDDPVFKAYSYRDSAKSNWTFETFALVVEFHKTLVEGKFCTYSETYQPLKDDSPICVSYAKVLTNIEWQCLEYKPVRHLERSHHLEIMVRGGKVSWRHSSTEPGTFYGHLVPRSRGSSLASLRSYLDLDKATKIEC